MKLANISLKLEPRDAWIGLFWDVRPCRDYRVLRTLSLREGGPQFEWFTHPSHLHVYICALPFVVLHIELTLGQPEETYQ